MRAIATHSGAAGSTGDGVAGSTVGDGALDGVRWPDAPVLRIKASNAVDRPANSGVSDSETELSEANAELVVDDTPSPAHKESMR